MLMIARISEIFDYSYSIAAKDIAFIRDAYSSFDSSSDLSKADKFEVLSVEG
jgi:hypothetical protein